VARNSWLFRYTRSVAIATPERMSSKGISQRRLLASSASQIGGGGSQHSKLPTNRSDVPPASAILFTDPVDVLPDQCGRLLCFKQRASRLFLAEHFCRIRSIVASLCANAYSHPLTLAALNAATRFGWAFTSASEAAQVIAVEVNAGCRRCEGAVWRAQLLKDEGLVGTVSNHRVGPAGQEIAWIALVRDAQHGLIVDALALQHRSDLVANWRIHQRPSAQIRHAPDVGPTRDHDCGTLEDRRQNYQPAARCPVPQHAGAADPEVRITVRDRLRNIDIRAALPKGTSRPASRYKPCSSA
jgi:hypothetical protein